MEPEKVKFFTDCLETSPGWSQTQGHFQQNKLYTRKIMTSPWAVLGFTIPKISTKERDGLIIYCV